MLTSSVGDLLCYVDKTADLYDIFTLGDQVLGSSQLADDCSGVCLVRCLVKSLDQSDPLWTLIRPCTSFTTSGLIPDCESNNVLRQNT